MVINEVILGALQSALARGESLKKAMMTVYNAGYKKEEISEAARSVQSGTPIVQPQVPSQTSSVAPPKKSLKTLFKKPAPQQALQPQQPTQPMQSLAPSKELTPKTEQPLQPTSQQAMPQQTQPIPQQIPQQIPPQQTPLQQAQQPQVAPTPQRVSSYGQPPKPAGKTIIIILGFLLLLLVGILVTIFLFKEELINFFNNLFS